MSEQLSLFTIHPVQVSKPKSDPYWDEIVQEKPTLKPGSKVKLSPDWMNKCEAATSGKYKKDYQFTSEEDLICKVLWVDPRGSGDISVSRNGYGLYIPAGYFTLIDDGDTVNANRSLGRATQEPTKHLVTRLELVNPSLFTTENVRPQDTQKSADEHSTPEFTAAHSHWVQEYWVKRGNTKHYYYRYCWMVGRKKNCIHLGAVGSARAKSRKLEVESAIADGDSPSQIQNLIRSWKS